MSNNLFYDIECLKYDSLVVFKDENNREVAHFWSKEAGDEYTADQPNGFEKVEEIIKGKTIIGYNNYNYDDVILYEMLRGRSQEHIKKISDCIISGADMSSERKCALNEFKKIGVVTIDAMQQIDVSRPGLKKIEGNMGRSIVESEISFDIDRPLTEKEKEIMLSYCRYDVQSTIEIFRLREESYFRTKNELIEMLGKDSCRRWNTTTISANILLEKPETIWSTPRYPDKYYRNIGLIPEDVWEMWDNIDFSCRDKKSESITVSIFDCDITFGMGGLHGAIKKQHKFEDVKLLDVSSMYPSIITLINGLGKGTEKYAAMRDERLQIKHTDPVKSAALKLVLNSVYGNLKNRYSILYNPMAAVTVCVYGQISLFDLCRRLYNAGYTIVNINTDGVAFVDRTGAGEAYLDIWKQWERDFALTLELDEFDLWIQKDVNNYVATKAGKIKTKGGECNRYASDNFFSNNNARIIQIALVDKLLFDKDPLMTIVDNLDKPILFQYVLKAGNTYKGVFNEEGKKMQNVNRVFAAKEGIPGTTMLYKVRQDDGRVCFPDTPERMYVFNGDLCDFADFKEIVDIQHYYDMVRKKLEGWSMY